jgi:HEAT repeat protein
MNASLRRWPWALGILILLPGGVAAWQSSPRATVEAQIGQHISDGRLDLALSSYDAYVIRVKQPDIGLLTPVAREELRAAVRRFEGDAVLHSAALERLARAGDADALKTLKASVGPHSAPALSLARLDDKQAPARLGALLVDATGNEKVEIIRALADGDARGESPKVAALLTDADPQVRAAAARAVGVLGYREAIPQLKVLFEQDPTVVRRFAAVALKRLGDSTADVVVAEMLASNSPDLRLMAAAAYPPTSRALWVEQIKALRYDRNELVRVRAAEVLACCDPDSARGMLLAALAHPDPSMRVEVARVLEGQGLADARIARQLLGDTFPQVRLYGAGAVLKLAR